MPDQNEGWLIPARSVINADNHTYVWVYNPNDSTINKNHVEVIEILGDNTANVRGLDGTEMIIETGVKQLYDGEKVVIVKDSDFSI